VSELSILRLIIITWFALAAVVFITLFFFVAPYGRHVRKGWGPTTNSRFGWVLMEAPAALVFAICFAFGVNTHLLHVARLKE
jgi:3-oxo-5-alpha-steroid 4-dehydrogenase 1